LTQKGQPGDWRSLLASIDHSLSYLHSPAAAAAYRRYPIGLRVIASVVCYASANYSSCSPAELQAAVSREFEFYQATGKDGGNVLFTAYYEPIYTASRVPTAEYRYPLSAAT